MFIINFLLQKGIVASICNYHQVPHFMTTWMPEDLLPIGDEHSYTRNLFPESNVYSRALAQIIVEYEWKSFTILYDHPDGIIQTSIDIEHYN